MLDGGFFTAALAFVGIVPAHETIRHEPQIPMAPMSGLEVARPTTTESPLSQGASVSATHANPVGTEVLSMARIADIHAIPYFIDEWIEEIGESNTSLDELLRSYADMRKSRAFLPPISKKKFSQLLALNGCIRMYRDIKGKDGARHRFVVFEMRARRQAIRRAA